MAKEQLTQGIAGAVVVASEATTGARLAAIVGHLVNMSYGREDELLSDELGVRFMSEAGLRPLRPRRGHADP